MDKKTLEELAALVNVKAEEVANLYVTEGDEEKLKDNVNPLEVVKGWVKTRLDDTWKASERKTATRFEAVVKSKGFDSDLQGVELLDAYLETVKAKPGSDKPGEWEKKYQTLEAAHAKTLEQLTAKDAEIEKARQEGFVRETQARLTTDARKFLGDKWAGTDAHFTELMRGYDPRRVRYDNGVPYLLDDSGEIAKDDLHRPLTLEDDLKRRGELIGGFHAVDPKKGGPPRPVPGGKGGESKISLASDLTPAQFTRMYEEASEKDRPALLEARQAQLDAQ